MKWPVRTPEVHRGVPDEDQDKSRKVVAAEQSGDRHNHQRG